LNEFILMHLKAITPIFVLRIMLSHNFANIILSLIMENIS